MAKAKKKRVTRTTGKVPNTTGFVYGHGPVVWVDAEWDSFHEKLPGIRWTREMGSDILSYHKPPKAATEIVAIKFGSTKDPTASVGSIVNKGIS